METMFLNTTVGKAIGRIALFALFTAGLFLLFCAPDDDSATWLTDLLLSKAACVMVFVAFAKLSKALDKA